MRTNKKGQCNTTRNAIREETPNSTNGADKRNNQCMSELRRTEQTQQFAGNSEFAPIVSGQRYSNNMYSVHKAQAKVAVDTPVFSTLELAGYDMVTDFPINSMHKCIDAFDGGIRKIVSNYLVSQRLFGGQRPPKI